MRPPRATCCSSAVTGAWMPCGRKVEGRVSWHGFCACSNGRFGSAAEHDSRRIRRLDRDGLIALAEALPGVHQASGLTAWPGRRLFFRDRFRARRTVNADLFFHVQSPVRSASHTGSRNYLSSPTFLISPMHKNSHLFGNRPARKCENSVKPEQR